jgi:hypothetical protein
MASPREPQVRDERGPYGQLARLFLTQLLAVIAIAAVITTIVAVTGAGLNEDVTARSEQNERPAAAGNSSSPAGSTPTPEASSGQPSTPTTSSAPATSASSATSRAARPPKVDVLNQSAGNGAASRAADQLRAAGWRIGRVDDFRGNVSATTVYWLTPDMRRDARRVARDLGGVRVQQGFSTLVDGRISVILVD